LTQKKKIRKARVNYVYCRTGKDNLQAWQNKIGDTIDPAYRNCGRYVARTGVHAYGADRAEMGRWGV